MKSGHYKVVNYCSIRSLKWNLTQLSTTVFIHWNEIWLLHTVVNYWWLWYTSTFYEYLSYKVIPAQRHTPVPQYSTRLCICTICQYMYYKTIMYRYLACYMHTTSIVPVNITMEKSQLFSVLTLKDNGGWKAEVYLNGSKWLEWHFYLFSVWNLPFSRFCL